MLNHSRKLKHISSNRGRLSPRSTVLYTEKRNGFRRWIYQQTSFRYVDNLVNDSILIETDAACILNIIRMNLSPRLCAVDFSITQQFDSDVTQRIVYYLLGAFFKSPIVSMERTLTVLNAGIVCRQLIRVPELNTVVRLNWRSFHQLLVKLCMQYRRLIRICDGLQPYTY